METNNWAMYQNAKGAVIQIHTIERPARAANLDAPQKHASHRVGYPRKMSLGNASPNAEPPTIGCVRQIVASRAQDQ